MSERTDAIELAYHVEMLRKHEEAVRLIRRAIENDRPGLAVEIIDALGQFHPMDAESWCGWPKETP